jgi:putative ATP-dependent endonuclease of OLD family
MLKKVITNFGYRLNALSAEVFFSDGVFLVEGTSEVLMYNALAKALCIDLDRLNISILSVEGIGFKPYVAVCNALNIPWVLRTDNDIFSKPTNAPVTKYFAGVSRIMGILEDTIGSTSDLVMYWTKHKEENEWPKDEPIPDCAQRLNTYIGEQITSFGCYLSKKDLECDLINSPLVTSLQSFYGRTAEDSLAKAMKARKAENMLDYLTQHRKSLSLLILNPLSFPLQELERKVKERIHPDHGKSAD